MNAPPDLQHSLDLLAKRLVEFSRFPKYSLERRVDIFLVPFLESFVKASIERDAQLVAPEFPILSDLRERGPYADVHLDEVTRRTVNVDYLFRLTGGGVAPGWLFLELKTDAESFDKDQADLYAIARLRGMRRLRADIDFILEKTVHLDKYTVLRNALPEAAAEVEPIRVAYLAPESLRSRAGEHVFPRTPAQVAGVPSIPSSRTVDDFLSLEDLAKLGGQLASDEFAPLWPTVKAILAAIGGRGTCL